MIKFHSLLIYYYVIMNIHKIKSDRMVEVQLMMNSLHRQSKKCDSEERNAKAKAKSSYQNGDPDQERIFAEIAVRKHKESQHYQMLSARLSPMLLQLKDDFAHHLKYKDSKKYADLLRTITMLSAKNDFAASASEIGGLVENLNSDVSPSAHGQMGDIGLRLANL